MARTVWADLGLGHLGRVLVVPVDLLVVGEDDNVALAFTHARAFHELRHDALVEELLKYPIRAVVRHLVQKFT